METHVLQKQPLRPLNRTSAAYFTEGSPSSTGCPAPRLVSRRGPRPTVERRRCARAVFGLRRCGGGPGRRRPGIVSGCGLATGLGNASQPEQGSGEGQFDGARFRKALVVGKRAVRLFGAPCLGESLNGQARHEDARTAVLRHGWREPRCGGLGHPSRSRRSSAPRLRTRRRVAGIGSQPGLRLPPRRNARPRKGPCLSPRCSRHPFGVASAARPAESHAREHMDAAQAARPAAGWREAA